MAKRRRHPPNSPVSRTQPKPEQIQRRSEYIQITYEAPLPPPQMLAEYERVLPGISDRMVRRMESQSEHRQGLENQTIGANIAGEKRGQIIAGVLALVAILASFYLIATGKDRYGIYIFITTFASLVTIFIAGKIYQSRQLAKRRKELRELLPRPPAPPSSEH
jgi:uncharacterized membrane protein